MNIVELNLSENEQQVVSKISADIQQQGESLQDQDTQIAFLDKLIDSDLNLAKVDGAEVAQHSKQIKGDTVQESGHGPLGSIHSAIDYAVDDPEVIEKIIHFIEKKLGTKIESKKVIATLRKIKNVLVSVPNLIKKGVYKLLKMFGLSIEGAKIGSLVGISLFLIACLVVATIFLPAEIAAAGSLFGFGLLLVKLTKLGVTISGIWKSIRGAKVEGADEIITPNDFFDALEDVMDNMDSKKFPLTKKGVDYEWVKKSGDWFNQLNQQRQNMASQYFKSGIKKLKAGEDMSGVLKGLDNLHFPHSRQINLMLTTTQKNLDSQKYYQGPMGEEHIRDMVRGILRETFFDLNR